MKNRLADTLVCGLMACALLAATPLPAQIRQSIWKGYSYPSDGFAITAPSEPKFATQVKSTDAGNVEVHTYSIVLADSNVVMISSSEVRGLEKEPPKARLQKAKEGALKAGNATLTSEKEIVLGVYPGLQYEATAQDLQVRARMYIVQNKLIQMLEIAPVGVAIPADADRISNSLKLLAAK
jgi:hypothetical protein